MALDTVISALAGTLVGGSITLIGVYFQTKQQTKREQAKIAVDLALQEYQRLYDTGLRSFRPFEFYIIKNFNFLSLIHDGKVTTADLKKVQKRNQLLEEKYASGELG